jgi:hypothetical protein
METRDHSSAHMIARPIAAKKRTACSQNFTNIVWQTGADRFQAASGRSGPCADAPGMRDRIEQALQRMQLEQASLNARGSSC